MKKREGEAEDEAEATVSAKDSRPIQIFIECDTPITIRKNSDRKVVLSQLDSVPMRILGNATNMKKE